MNRRSQYRVACLGAGYFSQFHYDAWKRMPYVTLVGSADHNLDAARATGLPAYAELHEMLVETKPDILDIILPPGAHKEAIDTALEIGVKTIICQKLFCIDLAEATGVTERAEAAGANLIVHENIRFMPWYRTIRSAIDAGQIGAPLQASFRLRPGDGQGPRAYLDRQPYFQQMPRFLIHETGVHWIDTFRFLFGDPTAVYADLRQINPVISGEDAGFFLLDHPAGVRTLFDGNRHCDHVSDNHRRTMGDAEFEGTDGTLTLSGDGSVRFRAKGDVTAEILLAPDTAGGFGGDCVHHLQNHVINALRTDSGFENTARSYLDVLRIKDAIYLSAETGRKIFLVES
ncbi:Gfo/Idh/MocA family oxidoreductase [uncultured Roseobacter sp.]|uniref:Gfo/Idh/MocA family protein n=1 Tax=uncultured Roseobacter sp. TaxID=114847 RepID=UPI002620DFEA|nr:Gfo/Idh/MocA family oxidoreductase [uncultured Roseobacter sp.]